MGKTVVDLPCVHGRLAFGLAALYTAKKDFPGGKSAGGNRDEPGRHIYIVTYWHEMCKPAKQKRHKQRVRGHGDQSAMLCKQQTDIAARSIIYTKRLLCADREATPLGWKLRYMGTHTGGGQSYTARERKPDRGSILCVSRCITKEIKCDTSYINAYIGRKKYVSLYHMYHEKNTL